MKHKKYEIENLEQLLNVVSDENIERLSIDFFGWLHFMNNCFKEFKATNPEFKNKLNSEIAECKFVWVDDGKTEIKGVQLKTKETGQITYIKNKK